MIFTKMHGLGNDYVCINCFRERVEDPPGFARALCDRHYGIGADGLILICPSKVSDFKMEIYNSDGSVAGMCGNGIRCLGKYVYDYRLTGKETLSIETKSGIRNMHLHIQDGKACGAMVDMGVPRLNAHSIPILSEKDLVINDPIEVQKKNYRMTGISMGNPHAVIFFRRDKRDFFGRDRKGVRISSEISGESKYRVLSCDCEGPDGDPCVGAGCW